MADTNITGTDKVAAEVAKQIAADTATLDKLNLKVKNKLDEPGIVPIVQGILDASVTNANIGKADFVMAPDAVKTLVDEIKTEIGKAEIKTSTAARDKAKELIEANAKVVAEKIAKEKAAAEAQETHIEGHGDIAKKLAEVAAEKHIKANYSKLKDPEKTEKVEKFTKHFEGLAKDYFDEFFDRADLEATTVLALQKTQVDKMAEKLAKAAKENPGRSANIEYLRTKALDETFAVRGGLTVKGAPKKAGDPPIYNPIPKENIDKLAESRKDMAKTAGIDEKKQKELDKKGSKIGSNAAAVGMSTGAKIGTSLGIAALLLVAWNRFKAAFVGRDPTEEEIENGAPADQKIKPSVGKMIGNAVLVLGVALGAVSLGMDMKRGNNFGTTAKDQVGSWVDYLKNRGASKSAEPVMNK